MLRNRCKLETQKHCRSCDRDRRSRARNPEELPNAEIVAVDVLAEMLELAKKGRAANHHGRCYETAIADSSFDCVTVASVCANMEDWGGALREWHASFTANGHLLILEFSLLIVDFSRGLPLLSASMFAVSRSFVTRQKNAYDYLGQSIEEFQPAKRCFD